jgi:predicted dehydrogenase
MTTAQGRRPARVALIGLGTWAGNIIRSLPETVRLAAVVTQRSDAASLVPADCLTLHDLSGLAALGLDGVIVANSASLHIRTLRAIWSQTPRMPVFVEKPVGLALPDVKRLANEYPDDDNPVFLVDHIQLFNENLRKTREALGNAGGVAIGGTDGNDGPVRADCNALWDYGPHAVSIALFLAGTTGSDATVTSATRVGSDSRATYRFFVAMGDGSTADLTVTNNAQAKARRYSVRGIDGREAVFDGLAPSTPAPLSAALTAFATAIDRGKPPTGDLRWGWTLPLAVTRLLHDAERIAQEGATDE